MKNYTLADLKAMTREEVEAIATEKKITFNKRMSKIAIAKLIEYRDFNDSRTANKIPHISDLF